MKSGLDAMPLFLLDDLLKNWPGRHLHDITDLPEFCWVKHLVFFPHGFGSQGFSFWPWPPVILFRKRIKQRAMNIVSLHRQQVLKWSMHEIACGIKVHHGVNLLLELHKKNCYRNNLMCQMRKCNAKRASNYRWSHIEMCLLNWMDR